MYRHWVKIIALSFIAIATGFSSKANSEECDISGVWDHSAKPAKLFVDIDKGEVSVHSHELNSESIGLVVLQNLQLGLTPLSWHAQMYSATEGAFVDVEISTKSWSNLSDGTLIVMLCCIR